MKTYALLQKPITYFQPKLWCLGLLGLSMIALLIGACKKVEPTPVLPTKVELSLKQGKKAELPLGNEAVDLNTIFDVKVTPDNVKNKKVSWSLKSDADREKASLVASGVLTTQEAGAITLVVTADADKTIKGEASFTIKEVSIQSIAIASKENSLAVGEKLNFTVRTTPTAQAVTWSVSDETIASINANGQLTAKKAGTLTVKAMAGSVTSNKITITVQSPPVTAITIQSPQTSIEVGETLTLTATTTPADKAVTWAVNDESLASIDAKGKLTAKRKGTVKVTAKADGITSNEVSIKLTATSVTAVTIQSSKTNLEVGEMLTLTATTTPTGRAVVWSVSDETVASIDEQGMLTTKKAGSIQAQAKVGDVESNELTISVSASSVTAVAIQSAKATLTIGETITLTATTTPADRAVAWSVDKETVASIDEQGMLTAKQSGTVKVTATAVGSNVSDEKTITVQAPPVTQVIVTAPKTNIYVNEIISLTATTTPSGRAVTWSVDDASIANIRENGQLTAKKVGTVNVTAKAGNKSSTPLKITIQQPPVTRVVIESPQDALGIGEKINLTATTTPTGRAVTWSVSDETIASIDANGQLTAKKVGTLTVTATAEGVTSNTLTLTVTNNPLIIKGKDTVYLGDSTNFTAELSGATTNATWSIKETGDQYGTINAQGVYKAPRFLKVSKSDDIKVTIVATTADKTTTKQLTISLDSFPNKLEITKDNKATYSNTTNGNRTIYLGVTVIGAGAFFNNRLTSVTIPNSVTSIGDVAFQSNQLTSVAIPNSVTSIGIYAFQSNQLTSVAIPNSVTSIEEGAFYDNKLTNVTIPDAVTSIGDGAFYDNKLTNVTIPDAVTSIGKQAFQSNQLTSVAIPNSVTSIGNNAFKNNELMNVTMQESLFTNYKDRIDKLFTFQGKYTIKTPAGKLLKSGNAEITVTKSNKATYTEVSAGALTFKTDKGTIKAIAEASFLNANLTSVSIPSSVTSIGAYAFRDNQLTSLIIPDAVTTIEPYAFSKNKLTSVTIPNSVTSIGKEAFFKNQLTSVAIPNSVTSIGSSAFADNKLTSVTIPDAVTSIEHEAFADNKLTSVTIPDAVTFIGQFAFLGNKLTSVTIPDAVTSIKPRAFTSNPNLTEVTLSKTLWEKIKDDRNGIFGTQVQIYKDRNGTKLN